MRARVSQSVRLAATRFSTRVMDEAVCWGPSGTTQVCVALHFVFLTQ